VAKVFHPIFESFHDVLRRRFNLFSLVVSKTYFGLVLAKHLF